MNKTVADRQMGKVVVTIALTNWTDTVLAARGFISEEDFAHVGLIPLEDLGLDPDLQNQKLRHLPTRGEDAYLMVL
ncbi:MAG: hypothetical protein AAFY72_00905 [Cyanobacteria bacterium J06649_4]